MRGLNAGCWMVKTRCKTVRYSLMVLSEMSSSSNSRMSLRSVALLASVLSFRASERRRSIILWGSRTRPSRRLASDSATCSMYERGASALLGGSHVDVARPSPADDQIDQGGKRDLSRGRHGDRSLK